MHPFLVANLLEHARTVTTVRASMLRGLLLLVFRVSFFARVAFEAVLIFFFELRIVAVFMNAKMASLAL